MKINWILTIEKIEKTHKIYAEVKAWGVKTLQEKKLLFNTKIKCKSMMSKCIIGKKHVSIPKKTALLDRILKSPQKYKII